MYCILSSWETDEWDRIEIDIWRVEAEAISRYSATLTIESGSQLPFGETGQKRSDPPATPD